MFFALAAVLATVHAWLAEPWAEDGEPAELAARKVAVVSARVHLLDEYGAGAERATTNGARSSAPSLDATAAIVSRTPPELASVPGVLATYRLPSENQNRFEIEVRCQEGAPGAIRASVLPRRPPKTCVEVVREVKPLCLHRRRLTGDEEGAGDALSLSQRPRRLGDGRIGAPPSLPRRRCNGPAGTAGNRLDTQASPANKYIFWATVRSQKLGIVPKS